jgi:hypothetical protein
MVFSLSPLCRLGQEQSINAGAAPRHPRRVKHQSGGLELTRGEWGAAGRDA